MGKIPGSPFDRKCKISHLWERHHRILQLLVWGYNPKYIASVLGCSSQNISDVRNSPLAQKQLLMLRSQGDQACVNLSEALNEDAPKSFELLRQIREARDDGEGASLELRARVAQDLLSRGPAPTKSKVSGDVTHTHYADEDTLKRVLGRAAEAKRLAASNEVEAEAEIIEEVA